MGIQIYLRIVHTSSFNLHLLFNFISPEHKQNNKRETVGQTKKIHPEKMWEPTPFLPSTILLVFSISILASYMQTDNTPFPANSERSFFSKTQKNSRTPLVRRTKKNYSPRKNMGANNILPSTIFLAFSISALPTKS